MLNLYTIKIPMTNDVETPNVDVDASVETSSDATEHQQDVLVELADLYSAKILDTYKNSELTDAEQKEQVQELINMER